MKKIILTLVMVVALAFGITACDTSSKNSGTVFDGIKTSEDFYAYSAASVGSLISSMNDGTSATSQRSLSMGIQSRDFRDDDNDDDDWNGGNHGENSGLTGELTEEQLATVNEYMALVESLLNDDSVSYKEEASDREGYDTKTTVSFKDMYGGVISYQMYYKEELVHTETDEDETENKYRLTGILIVGDSEYEVMGIKETEEERFDSETQIEFVAYMNAEKTSWLKVEQETETDEQEFVYSLYENGKRTERTTFEYEQERNETELKMTVEKNGQKDILKFEEEMEGNTRVMKVMASMNGENVNFKVFVTTNEQGETVYRYQFKDGWKDCGRIDFDD